MFCRTFSFVLLQSFLLIIHLSIVQVVSIASSRSLSGFVYVGAEIQSVGKWAEHDLLIVKSVQKQGSLIALSVHALVDGTIVYGIDDRVWNSFESQEEVDDFLNGSFHHLSDKKAL